MSQPTYNPAKTYFTCATCGAYLTRTEAATSPRCAGCRAQSLRAADRPDRCQVRGCDQPPTVCQASAPVRWICQAHADAELAEVRAAIARRLEVFG